MNLKYILGVILSLPLLPIMYLQGKRVKQEIPSLPEAEGHEGIVSIGAKKTLRLLTIGESTIAGVGVKTHEEGLTGTLAKELARIWQHNIQWKVYAKSGYTAQQVKADLIPQISEAEADLVVIGTGANDSFTLNTPNQWAMQVQDLINAIRRKYPTTPIVFMNVPPIKEFPAFTGIMRFVLGNLVEILGQRLSTIAAKNKLVYYNSEKMSLSSWIHRYQLSGPASDFFSDGVHPAKLTYQLWGKEMAEYANRVVGEMFNK